MNDFEEQAKARDPERCAALVKGHWDVYEHQCSRKKGYGYKGMFCKQHAGRKAKKFETADGGRI